MEKKKLSTILEGKIFSIPDYQRGYAWEKDQWQDFVLDIDALIDENISSHYTGTIVTYQDPKKPTESFGVMELEKVDVIDGQQRLTTSTLYLSIILKLLVNRGHSDYDMLFTTYLYSGQTTKIKLNNETASFYFDLIKKGVPNIQPNNVHQQRLFDAYNFLSNHVQSQLVKRKDADKYLKELLDALTRKMNFSFYTIEEESEIGMTFELMNSRGKGLSTLELLKNYLLHWIYRNISAPAEKKEITELINKSWKEIFTNIALCNGSESQCLRIAWTLYFDHTPRNWDGYKGFKELTKFPIRDFSKKSKIQTQKEMKEFVELLALISKHYAIVLNSENCFNSNEVKYLQKINRAAGIANYLPLIIASRLAIESNSKLIDIPQYIKLLETMEIYSYRVFLWEGKRSNAGQSKFYLWGHNLYWEETSYNPIIKEIYSLIEWYISDKDYKKQLTEDFYTWYNHRHILKYTLYEYELHLLDIEGKGNVPRIKWEDLSDATLEHILPQNPKANSDWRSNWTKDEIKLYLHDISNITLTMDNSSYSNFEFKIKKGKPGISPSYANSDIRQERKISSFSDWTPNTCKKRRKELITWIYERWRNESALQTLVETEEFEDDEELVVMVD